MTRIIYLLMMLPWATPAAGNGDGEIREEFSRDDIKSIKLHRTEWNLSYPIITLSSGDKLVLRFDQLGDRIETWQYSFIHCDSEWNESGLFATDYLDGFTENNIEDYRASFNTTVSYIHYQVSFPNRDISFKISGNYMIIVYPAGEPDNIALARRFMVSESSVDIDATPQRSKLTSGYDTHQQIDFTVNHRGLRLTDPNRTITATIMQNGRYDNARHNLRPDFQGDMQLRFNDLSGESLFPGGSEFRYFDIRSIRYQSEFIRSIEFFDGLYHVYLQPSEDRRGREYFYWQDFNGKYYTAIQEGRDHDTEADYLWVYFTFPSRFPLQEGDLYVIGALTGWRYDDINRMYYNMESHQYELSLLLKQGWYNYLYAVADMEGNPVPGAGFEGDHYETENDYLILIYYRDPSQRHERLLGHRVVNSSSN
ncbi:MAG: DUF5103 domain-containing protein [Bacteroidales bacterium]|nr:DUF5103 domain-containing protein [Bacteroidales bacterium]